ncbi:MAG: hypothetical protein AAF526_01310 [Pseudomonadota bacterium]
MTDQTLADFLASPTSRTLPDGVLTVLFCEDAAYVSATLDRALSQRPAHILCIGRTSGVEDHEHVTMIRADLADRFARDGIINRIIDRFDGRWIHWINNGDFFFYPWCESRSLGELAAFLADERRPILFSYGLDLYARELPAKNADPRLVEMWFDLRAYHAFPEENRRLAIFGGLGWRFEELFLPAWRQIGRAALFRAEKGVHIGKDMVFEDDVYVSVSAPWHNSPTGAVMSLRRTRHLFASPEFVDVQERLFWPGSHKFEWTSAQLLDLGMIEPGQWF